MPKGYKCRISNKVNGLIKRYNSVKLIADAEEKFLSEGKKVTDKNISITTGLSLKTIRRNKHLRATDIALNILEIQYAVKDELSSVGIFIEQ
jgi:hypothetical protein